MRFLDIVLGLLLLYGLWKGFKNGLFVELASIIALVAGIFGAIHFSYFVGDFLSKHIEWGKGYIAIAAFVITFIIIVLAVHLLGKFLTKVIDFAMLGPLNKIAGALFGALKVAVILGALLLFIDGANNTLGLVKEEKIQESILYEPIKEIGAFIFSKVLKKEDDTTLN